MQEQLLFPDLTVPRHFDGETYEPEVDRKRLTAQIDVVLKLMSGHGWWTIAQLADAIWKAGYKASQQGISARIRDLRKPRFGGFTVDRRRKNQGEYEYRLLSMAEAEQRRAEGDRIIRQLEGQ